jgi:hypothetical protein
LAEEIAPTPSAGGLTSVALKNALAGWVARALIIVTGLAM